VDKLLEICDHYLGKYCKGILQDKGHDCVQKLSTFSYKIGFILILLGDSNLMIYGETICEGVGFLTVNVF